MLAFGGTCVFKNIVNATKKIVRTDVRDTWVRTSDRNLGSIHMSSYSYLHVFALY